jgi:hypothetical protein
MEDNTWKIQRCKDAGEVRTGKNGRDNETTYWGISCRTCKELIAFDVCPYLSLGPGTVNTRPGAIRCSKGHNHIYFPKDFRFILSPVGIANEVMQEHRETYGAVNPASATFSELQTPDSASLVSL